MKKLLLSIIVLISLSVYAQDKKVINGNEGIPNGTPIGDSTPQKRLDIEEEKKKTMEAITNIQNYYDISEEGTLYPKGTFPRKQDTTKVLVICSNLDKITSEDGDEFTNPKLVQKILYIVTKPNSFKSYVYLDENKNLLNKELIIWQTKELPKK